ncbi:hypothetical protein ACKUB1_14800 [Methanospirillum stamsii]|nr:hypothetical protein [Methanospirillum stamsii]
MKKTRQMFHITLCILTLGFLVSGVYAYSVSSGSYSSSGSLSFDSSKGISKTSVTTISSPSQSQSPQGGQTIAPALQIPPTWILDINTATFFDPITNSAWTFDRILQKFYSPKSGLFLITLYQQDQSGNVAYTQYYYNPFTGSFYDILSGQILFTNPLSIGSPIQPGISATALPTQQPTNIVASSVSQSSSTIVASPSRVDETSPGGLDEAAQSSFMPYECPILNCPDCDGGYCIDCDNDGICDESGEWI